MFRIPFLRNLFILSLMATVCLPLYTLFVLHPSYHEELISETEEESIRFANYLLASLQMTGTVLERGRLPAAVGERSGMLAVDPHLFKLRFFSPRGEIIYSTQADEIGNLNERDYFHEIVARGQPYSKVVTKDSVTADGQQLSIDVVETYAPIMVDGQFGGAIEVYSDITDNIEGINRLTARTTTTLALVALVLMAAITLALRNASKALNERSRAEEALRSINEELEQRVEERTRELSNANLDLSNEIAERTLAQMALSQALEDSRVDREKLEGILRSVEDGILVTDVRMHVIHMNPAAEKLLGVPLENALGRPLDTLTHDRDFFKQVGPKLNNPENHPAFDFEVPVAGRKEPQVYHARIAQMETTGEASAGTILLLQDVTREREIERMKNAFLGMAAHELNTPLTAIIGFTELLSAPETSDIFEEGQKRECLGLIHEKALSLARLVDDMLDISRIESGQALGLNYTEGQLDKLIREVVRLYREDHPAHRFELLLPEGPVTLEADCGRLQQVLHNLVSNAIKYSPKGGPVRISAVVDDEFCRFTVADEGIGMSEEQVEHIFDRFYRVDSSNSSVQGVGLGMSIVKHIIDAHEGSINVSSRLGEGTEVTVNLPVRARGLISGQGKFSVGG